MPSPSSSRQLVALDYRQRPVNSPSPSSSRAQLRKLPQFALSVSTTLLEQARLASTMYKQAYQRSVLRPYVQLPRQYKYLNHHRRGPTQPSQVQYSMTTNPDFKTCAVHPLARFPTEIWLEIAEHTTRVDRRLLQMSSKSLYTILPEKDQKRLVFDDKVNLKTIAENDWLHLPAHQLCVMCDKYHLRQHVQPRSKPWAVLKLRKDLCLCTAGIRLSADKILCQRCWSQLLLGRGDHTL